MNRQGDICGRRGMSLVEVTIASAISFLVASSAVAVMITSLKTTEKATAFHKVNREARFLCDTIARDVRGAVGVDASYTSGQTTYATGSGSLVLRVPSVDAQGRVVDVKSAFDTIVYRPDGGRSSVLVREVFPGASSRRPAGRQIFGNAIGTSAFEGTFASEPNALGAHVIHYQFMVTETKLGQTIQMPVSGSVRLRNKN